MLMMPITSSFVKRGCEVTINAAYSDEEVLIRVRNIRNPNRFGSKLYSLQNPSSFIGYDERDLLNIKSIINKLLEKYGDTKCRIRYIKQIIS